jgi:hypothetical protein
MFMTEVRSVGFVGVVDLVVGGRANRAAGGVTDLVVGAEL